MHTGAGHFAAGEEARDAGATLEVGLDAAAGIVSRGHYRNRLPGDIDFVAQAVFINIGKAVADFVGI